MVFNRLRQFFEPLGAWAIFLASPSASRLVRHSSLQRARPRHSMAAVAGRPAIQRSTDEVVSAFAAIKFTQPAALLNFGHFGTGGHVAQPCRECGSPTRLLEVSGGGGGALFLPLTRAFEATLGDDFAYDGSEPRWLCRFLDGRACPACGACDLAAHDATTYLECDGPHLPSSPLLCRVCGGPCLGPIAVEVFGGPGTLLAYLGPKFGAPLAARVCRRCGQVWLGLYREDTEARRELAARFPDGGPCDPCRRGRLRATRTDVPHAGFGGLYDPSSQSGPYGAAAWAADLLVVVCDGCGEAVFQARWPEA